MSFKVGDKVRAIRNHDLVGIVDEINISYINTIDVRLINSYGNNILYQTDPDNWELYFEVGDLVTSNRSGSTYSILKIDDGWVKLKNVCGLISKHYISDYHHASEQEKDKYYKEFHDYTVSKTKFKVGDIVKHKSSGMIYQIWKKFDEFSTRSLLTGEKWVLERFISDKDRVTRWDVKTDDIQMASDAERLEFLRLKELTNQYIHT